MTDNNVDTYSRPQLKVGIGIAAGALVIVLTLIAVMLVPVLPDFMRFIVGIAGILIACGGCYLSKRIAYDA